MKKLLWILLLFVCAGLLPTQAEGKSSGAASVNELVSNLKKALLQPDKLAAVKALGYFESVPPAYLAKLDETLMDTLKGPNPEVSCTLLKSQEEQAKFAQMKAGTAVFKTNLPVVARLEISTNHGGSTFYAYRVGELKGRYYLVTPAPAKWPL